METAKATATPHPMGSRFGVLQVDDDFVAPVLTVVPGEPEPIANDAAG